MSCFFPFCFQAAVLDKWQAAGLDAVWRCLSLVTGSRFSGWAVTSSRKPFLCHFLSANFLQDFSLSSLIKSYTPTVLMFSFSAPGTRRPGAAPMLQSPEMIQASQFCPAHPASPVPSPRNHSKGSCPCFFLAQAPNHPWTSPCTLLSWHGAPSPLGNHQQQIIFSVAVIFWSVVLLLLKW